MKILVTGAAGFLGVRLVERLLARGETDLRCLLRPGSDEAPLLALRRAHPAASLEIVRGTLVAPADAARAVDGVELVHHLAAGVRGAPAELFLHTVVGTKILLEAIVAAPRRPRLALVSSFGVYGVAGLPRGALVDETTPLEPEPTRRDPYSQAKLRQEQLVDQYRRQYDLAVTILRPGVIYGLRGPAISNRVGLQLPGLFLHLGGDNLLPLTYVDNCAEAVALAGAHPEAVGRIYNVVDDDLPTCGQFLARYRREVEPLRVLRLPYPATALLGRAMAWYSEYSHGQLPALLTPYKVATSWGGNRFANDRLKGLGWRPLVSTEEGLGRTFAALREGRRGG